MVGQTCIILVEMEVVFIGLLEMAMTNIPLEHSQKQQRGSDSFYTIRLLEFFKDFLKSVIEFNSADWFS